MFSIIKQDYAICIPVYNEINNLNRLLSNINNYVLLNKEIRVEVYFCDDFSTDGSFEYLNKYCEGREKYNIMRFEKNNFGPGFIFKKFFSFLKNHNKTFDGVITIEADSTVRLDTINEMIIMHNCNYDLILASPYSYSGSLKGTNFFRKILSKLGNIFMSSLLGFNGINTLSSFMRLYDKSLINDICDNEKNISNGFVSVIEILYFVLKNKIKVIEIPITLNSDQRIGKSKLKIIRTILSYFKTVIKLRIYN